MTSPHRNQRGNAWRSKIKYEGADGFADDPVGDGYQNGAHRQREFHDANPITRHGRDDNHGGADFVECFGCSASGVAVGDDEQK